MFDELVLEPADPVGKIPALEIRASVRDQVFGKGIGSHRPVELTASNSVTRQIKQKELDSFNVACLLEMTSSRRTSFRHARCVSSAFFAQF